MNNMGQNAYIKIIVWVSIYSIFNAISFHDSNEYFKFSKLNFKVYKWFGHS